MEGEKTFLQRYLLEVRENFQCRRLEFGNNEKKRWFWAFSDKTKAGLVGTGNVQWCVSIFDGDAKQWMSNFGVEREREYMEVQGAGVCCCAGEKQRKKEKIIFLVLQKCKAC